MCMCGAGFVGWQDEFHTDMGYYSPRGHSHDDNRLSRSYICSEGHKTWIAIRRMCPRDDCGWLGRKADRLGSTNDWRLVPRVDEWPEVNDE